MYSTTFSRHWWRDQARSLRLRAGALLWGEREGYVNRRLLAQAVARLEWEERLLLADEWKEPIIEDPVARKIKQPSAAKRSFQTRAAWKAEKRRA